MRLVSCCSLFVVIAACVPACGGASTDAAAGDAIEEGDGGSRADTDAGRPVGDAGPNGSDAGRDDGSDDDDDDDAPTDPCAGVVCTAADQCHEPGTCDPATGVCSNPPKPDRAPCDDGSACTAVDYCEAAACIGTAPVTCTAADACHVAGTCDPATGVCSNPQKPNGTACNDGDACTMNDVCQAGVCLGTGCPLTLLSEGFGGASFPAGWFRFDVDGRTPHENVDYVDSAWVVRQDEKFVAQQAAFSTSWYVPTGAADDWMVTPALSLPAAGVATCTLSWRGVAYDVANRDGYEVRLFTTAPTAANLASSIVLSSVAQENTTWTARTLDLTAYKGQTIHVAWRNNSNDKFVLLIDDVAVRCL